ncbi:hypothetical protein ACTPEM_23290, partial [Clostridioides difficile]
NQIDLERLDILPDTSLCNDCAKKENNLLGDAMQNPDVEDSNFCGVKLTFIMLSLPICSIYDKRKV